MMVGVPKTGGAWESPGGGGGGRNGHQDPLVGTVGSGGPT